MDRFRAKGPRHRAKHRLFLSFALVLVVACVSSGCTSSDKSTKSRSHSRATRSASPVYTAPVITEQPSLIASAPSITSAIDTSFEVKDDAGYSFDVALKASLDLSTDTTHAPPGYTDIVIAPSISVDITDTTGGGKTPPSGPTVVVEALYNDAALCKLPTPDDQTGVISPSDGICLRPYVLYEGHLYPGDTSLSLETPGQENTISGATVRVLDSDIDKTETTLQAGMAAWAVDFSTGSADTTDSTQACGSETLTWVSTTIDC